MLFPIIKVKENGSEHIVGTNSHDCLYIQNNAIHYLNTQGMVGTEFPDESGMYFAGMDKGEYSISGYPEIEFLTLEEVIELATKNLVEQTEDTVRLNRLLAEHLKKKKECEKELKESAKETGITFDTSGALY